MRSSSIAFVAFAVCTLVACDSDKSGTQPTPPLSSEAGVPPPASASRTVGHRNPFGDALQADNLMVDGDFELTGRSDQAPWIVFNQQQQTLDYDTGGRCRSGVRCAVIGPVDALVGYMASPAVSDIEIRAYAKPDDDRCADVQVFAFDVASNNTTGSAQPATSAPDKDGWCMYVGNSPALAFEQPALYIQIAGTAKAKSVRIDQVSVLPVGEAPFHGAKIPLVPPTATDVARMNTTAAWLRAHRKYGASPRSTP